MESFVAKVRVGLGTSSLPFESGSAYFRWAELCEARGVDSLWQSDRLVSRDPYLEPLVALATLAGITRRLKFGMNAVVASLRDPLVLAKQCATIDVLSGGRLLPMFGVGDARAAEWAASGRDPAERGARADEVLELVQRLWSEDSVSFAGRFFRYEGASIRPRPLQQPLPLWIGGTSAAAIRRTARLGSGWIGGIAGPEEVGATIAAIRKEAQALGRRIDEDHYGATLAFRIGSPDDPALGRFPLLRRGAAAAGRDLRPLVCVGTARELVQRIGSYRRAGASKFVLFPIADAEADFLDQTVRVVEEVIPAVQAEAS